MAGGRTTFYINGDDKGFTKAVEHSRKKAEGFSGSMKRMGGKFKAVAGGPLKLAAVGIAAVGAAGLGAATALGALASAQADVIDRTSKIADSAGVSTEFYAGVALQAKEAGVEIGLFEGGLLDFNKNLADEGKVTVLESLNLSLKDLQGLNVEEQYRKVADAIGGIEDASQRARAADQLFGGAGVHMVRMFSQGSEAIDSYIEKQDILGESFTRLAGAQVEGMNDSLGTLKAAFEGVGKQIAIKVAPYVKYFADQVFELIKNGGGIKSIVGKGFEYVGATIGGVTRVVDVLQGSFYGVRKVLFSVIGYGLKGMTWLQRKIFDFVKDYVEPLLDSVGSFLGLESLGGAWKEMTDLSVGVGEMMADEMLAIADEAGKKSAENFKAAWNGSTMESIADKAAEIEASSIKAAEITVQNAEKMAAFQREAQKAAEKVSDESKDQTKELDKQVEKAEKKRYASMLGFGASARFEAIQRLDIINQAKKDAAAEAVKITNEKLDKVNQTLTNILVANGGDPSQIELGVA